jgi:methionyl-tRNA synthetase
VYRIAIMLYPFVPYSSAKLLEIFEFDEEPGMIHARNGIGDNVHINKELIKPVFAKLTEDQIRELYSFR